MTRRICITGRPALTIRKGRRADLLRLPITMDRINAANAILAFCRLVLLRRLQPLSKTASSITLTSLKTPWRTTSTVATRSSSSSVRPRTKPTVRAMRSIPPSKNFPVSARVSLRPVATAWLPLRFRVPSRAPMNSTLRLTRQSDLAIAVPSLPRCWRPMGRRRKTTCFRDFSRH